MPHKDRDRAGSKNRKRRLPLWNDTHDTEGHDHGQGIPGQANKKPVKAHLSHLRHSRVGFQSFQYLHELIKDANSGPAENKGQDKYGHRQDLDPYPIHNLQDPVRFSKVSHKEEGIETDDPHGYIMVTHKLAVACHAGKNNRRRNQVSRVNPADPDGYYEEYKHSQSVPGRGLVIEKIEFKIVPLLAKEFRCSYGELHNNIHDQVGINGKVILPPDGLLGKQSGYKDKDRHMEGIDEKIQRFGSR